MELIADDALSQLVTDSQSHGTEALKNLRDAVSFLHSAQSTSDNERVYTPIVLNFNEPRRSFNLVKEHLNTILDINEQMHTEIGLSKCQRHVIEDLSAQNTYLKQSLLSEQRRLAMTYASLGDVTSKCLTLESQIACLKKMPKKEKTKRSPDITTSRGRPPGTSHKKRKVTVPGSIIASSSSSRTDSDVVCTVCLEGESSDDNEILFCDKCNVAVHQSCYGVADIPDGLWYCDPCMENLDPSTLVCELCCNKGGSYKAVVGPGNKWVHSLCYRWIPEIYTTETEDSVAVIMDRLDKKRFKLRCSLCEEKGACVQCAHGRCQTAAHPWCVQHKHSKCVYRMLEQDVERNLWEMQMFCEFHANTISDGSLPDMKVKKSTAHGRVKPEGKPDEIEEPLEIGNLNRRQKESLIERNISAIRSVPTTATPNTNVSPLEISYLEILT